MPSGRTEIINMLDIKFVRENPDIVRENIKKKFQDAKLPLVDEAIELDEKKRSAQREADSLRADRNSLSKQIGALMGQGKKDEAEEAKKKVGEFAARLAELEQLEVELDEQLKKVMMTIPNIIDDSVPIGKDDSEKPSDEHADPKPSHGKKEHQRQCQHWQGVQHEHQRPGKIEPIKLTTVGKGGKPKADGRDGQSPHQERNAVEGIVRPADGSAVFRLIVDDLFEFTHIFTPFPLLCRPKGA